MNLPLFRLNQEMSDEDDESHPTETPQQQQQPPLTNNSTSGNKQGKCISFVSFLCAAFIGITN